MSVRRLSGNALAAVVNVVASAALLFALYRFLVAEIGADGIGVFSLVTAVAAGARLGDLGIGSGVVKFVAGDLGAGRPARAAATVGLGVVATALATAALCALLWPLLRALLGTVLTAPDTLAAALALLPWTLASLWLGSIASVFTGALDGAQRTDLRAATVTAAGVAQLLAAYALVPHHGFAALGPVQLVLAGVGCLGGALATVRVLPEPPRHWVAWSRGRTRELLRYGGGFQLVTLGTLAFEPSVKWLLGLFGTLTLNGFFELANRAVVQLRQIVAAAYQMLVPYIAARIGRDGAEPAALARTYGRAWRLLALLAIPWFAVVACLLPTLLAFWIGRHEPLFARIGFVCLAGWALNTIALPAFVLYLAVGRLRWSILTQMTIGVLNLALATAGGLLVGGLGVIGGAMLALALGSAVVVVAFHREYRVPVSTLLGGPVVPLLLGAAACIGVANLAGGEPGAGPLAAVPFAAALAMLAIAAAVAWRDPLRGELTRLLAAGRGA